MLWAPPVTAEVRAGTAGRFRKGNVDVCGSPCSVASVPVWVPVGALQSGRREKKPVRIVVVR